MWLFGRPLVSLVRCFDPPAVRWPSRASVKRFQLSCSNYYPWSCNLACRLCGRGVCEATRLGRITLQFGRGRLDVLRYAHNHLVCHMVCCLAGSLASGLVDWQVEWLANLHICSLVCALSGLMACTLAGWLICPGIRQARS